MTGRGARWSVRCWISSRVGACTAPAPREGQGQAPPVPAHREEDHRQPVGPEERVHGVLTQVPVQQDVGEQPVLRVGVPVEGQAQLAPDPAVRAVAADHVPGGDRLGLARRTADGRGDDVAAGGQAGELGPVLHHAAQFGDPRAEQPLGLVLREVQQEAEPRPAAREVQADQAPALGVEPHVPHHLAVLDEPLGQAHHVEDLQRAGVDADRPGLQGHPVALVDDAGADPAGQQFRGEHQPGRAGADDQHLAVRGRRVRGIAFMRPTLRWPRLAAI